MYDLTLAQNAGIDAFGLDIAAGDSNVPNSVATAFAAAAAMSGRTIKLYLIFDYSAWGAWSADNVISYINTYSRSAVYFNYTGKPLVSTFEGTGNTGDWTSIKASTNCFFVPDWSSLGAGTAASYSSIDGLASWNAWPEGPNNLTTSDDQYYQTSLGSKAYMMPVSPQFYTNLPQYSKNWLWYSDSLWHLRWLATLSVGPQFIQIISWNDYGESHYIGPIRPSGVVSGAWYVDSAHPHTAWLDFLPLYISAYKTGSSTVLTSSSSSSSPSSAAAADDALTYWYKSNPVSSGDTASTVCNNAAYQTTYPPATCAADNIFFTVNLVAPATISVSVGSSTLQSVYAASAGLSHFGIPTAAATGKVVFTVTRDGVSTLSVTGQTDITSMSLTDGYVNWNYVVGSSSSSSSSTSSS
ncbi:hypothetical protein UCRPC4_g06644 [Phaeomoniella chlamydospora]|uniref:Glycoside hydrolase family 71 protein n=1 Tax=Phaeomoniella chlamydospora TaxID=158046 RepID=A0A0G2DXN0_PHACM|nr:hypothetical protein UCRPC4_g06644 [Phaeomoniella chlamydospora]